MAKLFSVVWCCRVFITPCLFCGILFLNHVLLHLLHPLSLSAYVFSHLFATLSGLSTESLQDCLCSNIVVVCNSSQRGVILIPQSPLCFLVTATLFVPLLFSFPVAPSHRNNHHPIVLVLSVNCEQILMSPQFYSALAAFACHLPACKDTQPAIIPSLSPPWLITVLFPSLPPFFSHLSRYFLILSASRKKKFILSFFVFHYLAISLLFITFFSISSLP